MSGIDAKVDIVSERIKRLQKKLNYTFKNEQFLRQALTRQEAIEEKVEGAFPRSYQSLEFMGDAMLKACVAKSLCEKLPHAEAEQLHDWVQGFIQNEKLSAAARRLKLQEYIIKGKSELITDKMLADALEAIIGAICLDSKKMGRACQAFVEKVFKIEFQAIGLPKAKKAEGRLSVPPPEEAKKAPLREPQHATVALASKRLPRKKQEFWSPVSPPSSSPAVSSSPPVLSVKKEDKPISRTLQEEAKKVPLQHPQPTLTPVKKEAISREGRQAFYSGPAGVFETAGDLYDAGYGGEYDPKVDALWKAYFD